MLERRRPARRDRLDARSGRRWRCRIVRRRRSGRSTRRRSAGRSPHGRRRHEVGHASARTGSTTIASPAAPAWRGPGPDAARTGRARSCRARPFPSRGRTAPAVRIDAATLRAPGEALATLRDARQTATRVVIELDVDFDDDPLSADRHAAVRARPAVRLRSRRAAPPRVVEHGRRARPRSVGVARRSTWRSPRGRVQVAPATGSANVATATSSWPTARSVWLDGGPVRYVAADRRRARGARRRDRTRRPRRFRPATRRPPISLPDQLAAVTHPGGAARIIAPAGSGKTRVLTERARHLLTQWNLPTSAVSLVAFNKRAQEEMRERTADLPGLQVRTLNAIALAIVNGIGAVRPPGPQLAHDRRTGGAADRRRPRVVPASAQQPTRSLRGSRRSASSASVSCHPSRPSSSTTATSTGWPACGRRSAAGSNDRARSTSTIRSIGPCSCC